jgi:N-acyl amino acid synthase of PEP-CTERM/exosortase system
MALSAALGEAAGEVFMAGESGWQDFLSCYREHFEVVRASTPTLLDQVYRLRYQVYCVENAYEDPDRQPGGLETDIYDERSVHALLVHRGSEAVAGTVRVILPGTDQQSPPLPINIVADSEQRELLRRLPHCTAELSRFAVSKEFRQRCADAEDRRMLRYITIGLIRGALEMCRDNDIQYVCAVMERSLIRLLGRLGFVFDHLGGLIEYHGARQPCVAQVNQIVSTAEGTLWWRHAR